MIGPMTPFAVETALELRHVEHAIRYYQTMDNMLKLTQTERRVLVRQLWARRDALHEQLQQLLKPAVERYIDLERDKVEEARQDELQRAEVRLDIEREKRRNSVVVDLRREGWMIAEPGSIQAAQMKPKPKAKAKRKKT